MNQKPSFFEQGRNPAEEGIAAARAEHYWRCELGHARGMKRKAKTPGGRKRWQRREDACLHMLAFGLAGGF